MTNREAIKTLEANYPDACFEQLREAVDMAIEALTKEAWKEEHPVSPLLQSSKQDADDLISRKQAIDAVYKCADIFAGDMPVMVVKAYAYEALAQLPSAQPERPTGKWIATTSSQEGQITWRDYKCSNCSHHREKPMNFCEVCRAKMER